VLRRGCVKQPDLPVLSQSLSIEALEDVSDCSLSRFGRTLWKPTRARNENGCQSSRKEACCKISYRVIRIEGGTPQFMEGRRANICSESGATQDGGVSSPSFTVYEFLFRAVGLTFSGSDLRWGYGLSRYHLTMLLRTRIQDATGRPQVFGTRAVEKMERSCAYSVEMAHRNFP
jgi:hypothetical protein